MLRLCRIRTLAVTLSFSVGATLLRHSAHASGSLAPGTSQAIVRTQGSPNNTTGTTIGARPPQAAASEEWPTYGGTLSGQHYSRLGQINERTVARLGGAWKFHTGVVGAFTSFEAAPVVSNGVLYVTDPHSDVFALDAVTGTKRWSYTPHYATLNKLPICCGQANRGAAVGNGKVYVAQLDAKLIALDQTTGKPVWSVQVGNPREGYSGGGPPLYDRGRLYVGVAGGEYGIRGYFSAYDAATGKLLWRFYTVPGPGAKGHQTWPVGDAWRHGGGGVWTAPVLDRHLGLVYFVTGNPSPDLNGHIRAGNNLFTDCIVALDIRTGKLRWYFQEIHHDVWDSDPSSPPVLFDMTVHGKPVAALAQAGKIGWVYLLDRKTGKPLTPIRERRVPQDAWQKTAATQPYVTGDAFVPQSYSGQLAGFPSSKSLFPPASPGRPTERTPGGNGGSEWSPVSRDPLTGYLFVSGINEPQVFAVHMADEPAGKERLGSIWTRVPGGHYSGTLTAMDPRTNRIAWQKKSTNMYIGGTLATAGGLVFVGDGDGRLKAYSARNGQLRWSFQTGAGVNAPPITYSVNGRQYIAVASGGSWQLGFPRGDTLWVFALGGRLSPVKAQLVEPRTVVTTKVDILLTGFVHSRLIVPPGTTITWTNNTKTNQSVDARLGSWHSGSIAPGKTFSHTFRVEGAFDYIDAAAPGLLGSVIVSKKVRRAGGQ
jgi:quinohemoprotein ethanol dehydrogenase